MRRDARRVLLVVCLTSLGVGLGLLGEQAWLEIKGRLADVLIRRALAAHLSDGTPHPPWGWADMHPIAMLHVPRLVVRRPVLTGASGESMAFGLGHIDGTPAPNASGNCVVAGHRDGACAFLEHVQIGDVVRLETPDRCRRYVVTDTAVVSMHDGRILEPTDEPQLTLVTCYPFGSLRPSALRFAVRCQAMDAVPPASGGPH